jgi:hypothetical protein
MASFDDKLDTFLRQSMSGRCTEVDVDELLSHASFETMASAAADAAITSAWPDDGGEEDGGDDELPNEQADVPDDEMLGDDEEGADDAVEREIQEELLRELPSAKKPLRSAMRHRPADDDDLDVVVKRTGGDDDDNEGDKEVDDDEDDLTLPSDEEADQPVLVVRKPLLPEFRPDFSSSEDSQLSLDGAFEYDEDDDEDDWLSARDYEREDGDGATAAAVKKKNKKSKAAAAAAGSGGKRKRAVSAAADGDDAGNEQKVVRKALMEHKSRQSKMSADEQQAIMQAYIKVAAVDHFMQTEHKESGADLDSYKSFRVLVLEEAAMGTADDDIKTLAHAVLDIEADITDTIATTKRAEPDAMQLLLDFVVGATALTFAKEAVPAAASRCDVTLQPSSPADLVLATVTLAGGKVRHLALRAALQYLAQNLWTLANFYTIVGAKVAKALVAHKRLSTADALAALDADAEFTKRLVKLLGEAHSKTCWHVRMKLGSK